MIIDDILNKLDPVKKKCERCKDWINDVSEDDKLCQHCYKEMEPFLKHKIHMRMQLEETGHLNMT